MLMVKLGLILSGIFAAAGLVRGGLLKKRLTRDGHLLEYACEAGEIERARLAEEERQRAKEDAILASRVFGLDFLITHGGAFGGCCATCPDGRSRRGSVALDRIMMYGRGPSGKDYTYYIEDQGLYICAGEKPDQLLLRSRKEPFEIREAGLDRDQGVTTSQAVIFKDVLYYVILESHHEISVRATARC